ncbi:hypothetical protein GIB67_016339 [Kingdonia uniflora]|uniref:USP domain-containing protein n=1 Tax=Kingdonia uniflora TaxID=39325 RepID=A0A7J7M9G3_9MAGN|nr:hypothetical protein GIB67_016339 [Kingdonia uniflora]
MSGGGERDFSNNNNNEGEDGSVLLRSTNSSPDLESQRSRKKGIRDLLKQLDRRWSGRRHNTSPIPTSTRNHLDRTNSNDHDALSDVAPPEWALLLIGCLLGLATGSTYGTRENMRFAYSGKVNLRSGTNKIALLSIAVGLPILESPNSSTLDSPFAKPLLLCRGAVTRPVGLFLSKAARFEFPRRTCFASGFVHGLGGSIVPDVKAAAARDLVIRACLAFTRPLTAYLLQGLHSKACSKKDWCFTCEFEGLIPKAKEGISPLSLMRILPHLQSIGSHLVLDVDKYAIDTMQSLCLREAGVNAKDPWAEETTLVRLIFGGYIRSKIKCMKCKGKSERHERMIDLTVEIQRDIGTLEDSLGRYTATEILDRDNKYECSRCNSYERAKKKLTVVEAPNILTIALKRF